ncbi:TPA: hypothetical protein MH431_28045 [Klebsiella pneumoniae]|nr:hypothetical protein [Klebsiella pneumoniae]
MRPGNCSNALIWSLPARCRRQWYARRSPGRSDQSASSVAIQKYSVITDGHCCKVSDEAAFCLIQRPYISKTLLTRRISPRGSP